MAVVKFVLRLLVGVCLIGVLLYKHEVNLDKVFENVRQMPHAYILGAVVLYLMGQLMSAYRWGRLSTLGGSPVEFNSVWPVYFSGMFFNMCLPTSIGGDVVRVVGLSRTTGSKSKALASVFMDRNVGLLALLLIGLLASVVSCFQTPVSLEAVLFGTRYPIPVWPLFVLLLVGYIGANTALFSDGFCGFVSRICTRIKIQFLSRKIERLHDSLQEYKMPVARFIPAFGISVLYQISEIGVVWLLARGLEIDVPAWVFFALVPLQAVACLLPLSFNGVGFREFVFCAVLKGQLGDIPAVKSQALTLSLVFFGVVVLSSFMGGIVYMASGMSRPTVTEAEAVSAASGQ